MLEKVPDRVWRLCSSISVCGIIDAIACNETDLKKTFDIIFACPCMEGTVRDLENSPCFRHTMLFSKINLTQTSSIDV